MIQALVLDVDGVLTDGGIYLDAGGGEAKRFHSRDGVGIRLAQMAGWRVLFLTARGSLPAQRRAEELHAEWATGVVDKAGFLDEWLSGNGIEWTQVAFVADDLQDMQVLRRVGWPVAVADAVPEIRETAGYVTRTLGGHGAVREAVEWLLEEHGIREATLKLFMEKGFSVGSAERGGENHG